MTEQAPPSGDPEEEERGFAAAFMALVRPLGRHRAEHRMVALVILLVLGVGAGALVVNALLPSNAQAPAASGAVFGPAASQQDSAASQPTSTAGGSAVPTTGNLASAISIGSSSSTAPSPQTSATGAGGAIPQVSQIATQITPIPTAPTPIATQPTPTAKTYSAVAGLACLGNATATYNHDEGYYRNGLSGWLEVNNGGYTGDGCSGTYDAIPMSGTAGMAGSDPTAFSLYNWNFSGSFTRGSCELSVYIPNTTDLIHVGGNPTYYQYWNQDYTWGSSVAPAGSFAITQVGELGKWVSEAPFAVTTGEVTVKLLNGGVDYNAAGSPDYHHHAAAPIRLTCTSD